MIQESIHKKILDHSNKVDAWFEPYHRELKFPFYSSYDIRDSGHKVVPVDANIFPAGFNNICAQDKESSVQVIKKYLESSYPGFKGPLALLAEEHTANAYYWENVRTIAHLLEQAGFETLITLPREMNENLEVQSSSGAQLQLHKHSFDQGHLHIDSREMALIICNNDFSLEKEEWGQDLKTSMNPPRGLGWYRRKKYDFFAEYNQLAASFAKVIDVDPWCLQVNTQQFDDFDVTSPDSLNDLANEVDQFIVSIKEKYDQFEIEAKPHVYIKNNSGTYGMGVISASSGEEVRSWNAKARKKMKAAKGGRSVESLIIQEGVSTRFVEEGETAEPCIYMVGCQLVGGFLRAHSKKTAEDNLNSPGAVFKRLCMSDLIEGAENSPMENVYGWVSKLASIAAAKEALKYNVELPSHGSCSNGDLS